MGPSDRPTAPGVRLDGLDVLRGVAVLMIFSVNVRAMLGPFMAQGDPGAFIGPHDLRADLALQYLVDGKWIAVFAVLFGAGLALIHDKAAAAGRDPHARIVRRQAWLVPFGLCHLYLVWLGDVLTAYASVGLLAAMFLERRPRTIWLWAAGLLLGYAALMSLLGWAVATLPPGAMAAAGGTAEDPFGAAAMVEAELAAKRGGYLSVLAWRAPVATQQLFGIVQAGPMILAYMLTGIALLRAGFLTGAWRVRWYALTAAVLLGAAWGTDYWRTESMGSWAPGGGENAYALAYYRFVGVGAVEGLAGGVGYAALVMALVRAGLTLGPLAAAGRMAFSNYVACSLIGTGFAYGYGGGLVGEMTLVQAMIVVGGVWTAILIWSPLWLSAFRHGPLEWLWRSLTYGERQPFRRRDESASVWPLAPPPSRRS